MPELTHCEDCRFACHGEWCGNPAVLDLDDDQRAQYDDLTQPCPIFEACIALSKC